MFLSDVTIQEYLADGRIRVQPEVDSADIRPVGLRVHLAETVLVPHPGAVIDLRAPEELTYTTVALGADGFILEPGAFILASTRQSFQLARHLVAFIDGRSTIARLGLTVHVTAVVVDGNHEEPRSITLEMANHGPRAVRLRAGDAVGLVLFAQLSSDVAQQSQSQYQGQGGPLPPNLAFQPGVDR